MYARYAGVNKCRQMNIFPLFQMTIEGLHMEPLLKHCIPSLGGAATVSRFYWVLVCLTFPIAFNVHRVVTPNLE